MQERPERATTPAPHGVPHLAARWAFGACFVVYILTLAWVTLNPRPTPEPVPFDWMPLDNIIQVIREGESVSYADAGQLIGNIALFVPLGWLVPMLWPRLRSLWRVVAVAGATSLGIELAQLLFIHGRQSSIDDVILNVAGGLVGAVMFFAPVREIDRDTGRDHDRVRSIP